MVAGAADDAAGMASAMDRRIIIRAQKTVLGCPQMRSVVKSRTATPVVMLSCLASTTVSTQLRPAAINAINMQPIRVIEFANATAGSSARCRCAGGSTPVGTIPLENAGSSISPTQRIRCMASGAHTLPNTGESTATYEAGLRHMCRGLGA